MTPDKFFSNLFLAEYLTLFWTRIEKVSFCGVKIVTDHVKELLRSMGQKNGRIGVGTFHSSKSSICLTFVRHSLAFSGLFQAS